MGGARHPRLRGKCRSHYLWPASNRYKLIRARRAGVTLEALAQAAGAIANSSVGALGALKALSGALGHGSRAGCWVVLDRLCCCTGNGSRTNRKAEAIPDIHLLAV